MKLGDEFYIILWNEDEVCFDNYPSIAIYPTRNTAIEAKKDLELKFPIEKYIIKKIKIEIIE